MTVKGDCEVSQDFDVAVRESQGHRCCVTHERDSLKATYTEASYILDDDDLRPAVYLSIPPRSSKLFV